MSSRCELLVNDIHRPFAAESNIEGGKYITIQITMIVKQQWVVYLVQNQIK